MTYQTRITQLPDDLRDLISQHLHQSQMNEVHTELIATFEEQERRYLNYLEFVGAPPEYELPDPIWEEQVPEWA